MFLEEEENGIQRLRGLPKAKVKKNLGSVLARRLEAIAKLSDL